MNTNPKPHEVPFFVNIGFEVGGEVKYISTTALQAAFKDKELRQESFDFVIKHLIERA
jgi:hypothetical protein